MWDGKIKKKTMEFYYCPTCGCELDTGWECTNCERDWMPWAYPWWRQILNWFRG
jgi:hypothetical protein